jgi:hypothetical protein
MKAQEIVNRLTGHNGQNIQVCWQRQCKVRAGSVPVTKLTIAYVRAGIDYANLSAVQSGIANGERGEVEPLPWGVWQQFPYVIEHKGTEYVRLYPSSFGNLKSSVAYYIDGKPVDFADVKPFLLASEYPKSSEDKPLCFTVKAESIVSIQ